MHSPPQLLLDFLQLRPLAVPPSLPLKLEVSPAGSTADVGEAQEREGFRSAEPASRASGRRMAPLGAWLRGLLARAHVNTVVVALAAKLARTAWAVIRRGATFDMKAATAS